ncbi:MAG: GNAT family N-acetyltransferase [Candidatus Thiodiazotropha sp. L084R]
MRTSTLHLPDGLGIRPARDSDRSFIESLYHATRDDLRLIEAEPDFIESLIEQQQHAQTVGYGDQFPNAMYFIIEKQNERVGRIVIDFGPNEIRIVDVALIPVARGKGYATAILQALKHAATSACAPLVLSVYKHNSTARRLYEQEGFCVEQSDHMVDQMAWYPSYS